MRWDQVREVHTKISLLYLYWRRIRIGTNLPGLACLPSVQNKLSLLHTL